LANNPIIGVASSSVNSGAWQQRIDDWANFLQGGKAKLVRQRLLDYEPRIALTPWIKWRAASSIGGAPEWEAARVSPAPVLRCARLVVRISAPSIQASAALM